MQTRCVPSHVILFIAIQSANAVKKLHILATIAALAAAALEWNDGIYVGRSVGWLCLVAVVAATAELTTYTFLFTFLFS